MVASMSLVKKKTAIKSKRINLDNLRIPGVRSAKLISTTNNPITAPARPFVNNRFNRIKIDIGQKAFRPYFNRKKYNNAPENRILLKTKAFRVKEESNEKNAVLIS